MTAGVAPRAGAQTAGSVDPSFSAGSGPNGNILAMARQTDGRILVGGNFTTFAGASRSALARLNADGSLDTTFNAVLGPNGTNAPDVREIVIDGSGRVLIAGIFTSVHGDTNRTLVARLNADGSTDTGFTPNARFSNSRFVVLTNGQFLYSAIYSGPPPGPGQLPPRTNIVFRFNASGSLDTNYNTAGEGFTLVPPTNFIAPTPSLDRLRLLADGRVIAGGQFDAHTAGAKSGLARLNMDGTLDAAFVSDLGNPPSPGPIPFPTMRVPAVAEQPDGRILVGGRFNTHNGNSVSNLIRVLPADGSLDTAFGAPASGQVNAIQLQPDGRILVGGAFTNISGAAMDRIARLNADGSVDSNFSIGAGFDNTVNAMILQPDGGILVAGSFINFNGIPAPRIIRLNGGVGAGGGGGGGGATNTPPVITGQPGNQVVSVGGNASFAVSASGTAPLRYQWRFNGSPMGGATNATFSISNVQTFNAGFYDVVVSNGAGAATSQRAALTVLNGAPIPPGIVTHPAGVRGYPGASITLSVTATGTFPLAYQWRLNGAAITGANGPAYTIHGLSAGTAGVYDVVVSNPFGSATSLPATVTLDTSPLIVSHPASQGAFLGATVILSVVATGPGPFNYTWQKDGQLLGAPSQPFLVLTNVQPADAGSYQVTVFNASSAAMSLPAVLSVFPPPVFITLPPPLLNVLATSNTLFSCTATGNGAVSFQWRFNGTNVPGATTNTFAPPTARRRDSGTYNVAVTDSRGTVVSSNIVFRVRVPQRVVPPAPLPGQGFRLMFGDQDGQPLVSSDATNFIVQFTTNFTTWTTLPGGLTTSNGLLVLDDAPGTNTTRRFYRVIEP